MYINKIPFLLILLLLTCSCDTNKDKKVNPVIVSVGTATLTLKDLKNAIPENLHDEDSIAISEDYISRWIKTQLTLRKAELNLTADEKNVEALLQAYRTSLLVYLYQQKMLEQKHSPLVRKTEIEKYYNEMQDNFKLQENIFKGILIKVPKDSPNQHILRQLYRSNKPEDFLNLEAYCFQNARQFEVFEEWEPFIQINNFLPEPVLNEEKFLSWNKYFEIKDADFNYYVNIQEYMTFGQTAPLSYVENRIKAILLNKKRMEFIEKLEHDLYEEGLRDNVIKFY